MNQMSYDLTGSQFNRLVRTYRPSQYDTFGAQDPRFTKPMSHVLKCRDRLHVALRCGLRWLSNEPKTIVDFGSFVTRIGNVFKLLIGRSPNDRLAPPGYNDPNDEWRPHAREYAMHELAEMLRHVGFEIAQAKFFLGEDTQNCRQSTRQSAVDWVKVFFYLFPHLRGSLLVLGRKP